MKRLSVALLASTALACGPALSASITTRADSKTATIGNSGFGIYSFSGVLGLGVFDGGGTTPGAVPIAPVNAPFAIQRTGDTMNPGALLSFYLNGAVAPTSLQQLLTSLGAFYGFGGKGDAGSHLLSGITSFNGTNTTGFTLAQWQALFAGAKDSAGNNPVTALSNEADEVAIQAMINTSATGYQTETIVLPYGYMRFTHPIQSGCSPIDISGQGLNSTQLYLTGTMTDLWHHGTSETACPQKYGNHFGIKNLTVRTANIQNRAFDIVEGLDSEVIFSRVNIKGSPYTTGNATTKGSGQFYLNGVRCTSCSNVVFTDTNIIGPFGNAGAIAGNGLEIAGGGTGSMLFRGGQISGYHQCALSYSGSAGSSFPTSTNGDNEGVVFDRMQSTGCDDLYVVQWNGNGNGAAEYRVYNGQYGTTSRHFMNMAYVPELWSVNNLVYTNNPFLVGGGTFTSGSTTVTGTSYLGNPPPVGYVITGSFEGLPAGTTITAVNTSNNTLTMSNPAGNTTGNVNLSFQPTQAFTATAISGSGTLTGVSSFANDSNGYMVVQKDGCVYGVPGVTGCDAITAVDGYNMTVTVATAPNASGTVNGSFHYPETAPNLYSLNHISRGKFLGENIQMPPGDRMGSILAIANSKNVHIKDWDINDLGNVLSQAFYDQGGNKNLIESDTQYDSFNASGATAFVGGAFASNDSSVRWGSYYKGLGCDLGTSGKVTCSGLSGVTLNTTNSQATTSITLPNAFLNAPQIDAINGNFGVSTAACGRVSQTAPSAAAGTAPTFLAGCTNGSGNNVQINWRAVGY